MTDAHSVAQGSQAELDSLAAVLRAAGIACEIDSAADGGAPG